MLLYHLKTQCTQYHPVIKEQSQYLRLLEIQKNIKFYQASSSEMYGGGSEVMLNEKSIFDPKSSICCFKSIFS